MAIDNLITDREPLGPIDQDRVKLSADVSAILNSSVAPFRAVVRQPPIILFGRKGSGKSSVLAELQVQAQTSRPMSGELPSEGGTFVMTLKSWEEFFQLTSDVQVRTQASIVGGTGGFMPPELHEKLWVEVIWDRIIKFFYNFSSIDPARAMLRPVDSYMHSNPMWGQPVRTAAEQLFQEAQSAILSFLVARRSKLLLLFDSMDEYPVRNDMFMETLGGLLRAINSMYYDFQNVRITFCMPEEIEKFLNAESSNLLKDYASSQRIRWKPVDLLKAVAHRYRLCLSKYDEAFFDEIKTINLNERDGLHTLFDRILPTTIRNGFGEREDPLAYIIRHTQLLPRHAIAIFNSIISINHIATGGFRLLTEESISEGIKRIEALIAGQVLYPYLKIYPYLLDTCKAVLPDLEPICSYDQLRSAQSRFKQRVEPDAGNALWQTLFQMGVLGKVASGDDKTRTEGIKTSRYILANFHFNIDGGFGFSTDGMYCFHPVFSRYFGMARRDLDDKRVVYPAGVDMVTLT
jgi:hypothetical protein